MAKYCHRRIGSVESPYGPRGDLVWELDDDNRFVRALVAWPKRYEYGIYVLKARGEDGNWRKVDEVSDRLFRVRIRDVRGLDEAQEAAIRKDLAEGILEGLY